MRGGRGGLAGGGGWGALAGWGGWGGSHILCSTFLSKTFLEFQSSWFHEFSIDINQSDFLVPTTTTRRRTRLSC